MQTYSITQSARCECFKLLKIPGFGLMIVAMHLTQVSFALPPLTKRRQNSIFQPSTGNNELRTKEHIMGFKSTFDRMVAAREKQARRYVNGALMNLDDATLEQAGISRENLRRQGVSVYPF